MEKYFKRKRGAPCDMLLPCTVKNKKHKTDDSSREHELCVETTGNDLIQATKTPSEAMVDIGPSKSFNSKEADTSVKQHSCQTDGVVCCNTHMIIKHERHLEGLNVHYYPNFIKSLAKKYFQRLEKELKNYYDTTPNIVKVFGKIHTIPRRQTAFGDSGTSYSFSGVTVPANPWIPSILELKLAVEFTTNEHYNFVLVNYYRNGLDYIGEHRDDERELCPSSSIVSLSLGQERDFSFRHKDARGVKSSVKYHLSKYF